MNDAITLIGLGLFTIGLFWESLPMVMRCPLVNLSVILAVLNGIDNELKKEKENKW